MDDKTDGIEEEGITIKQEHAYASNDDFNSLSAHEPSSEDDPLKILPYDVEKVKTEKDCELVENLETVEIKVETDLDHIMENNDIETSEYIGNTHALETTHTVGDFVSKQTFMDLQEKYKNLLNEFMLSKQQMKNLSSENESLKTELINLRKGIKNMFTESCKQLKKDLGGAHVMGNNLKYEINCLAKQNLYLRNKLMECADFAKYEENMEKSARELKTKMKYFIQRENKIHERFISMRSEIEGKDRQQKILESRLQYTIVKLETLKNKIYEQSKMRALYYDSKKQRDRLQKELTDCMKVKYLYEDHADLIKSEMNAKLKERDAENEKYKKEIENLSNICFQNETNIKGLKEKMKSKSQLLETKITETGKMYLHEKQKAVSLQQKVLEKHNENVALKKEIDALKVEFRKYRAAKLEEKINEKHRENVILREEVAILKVELEKATLKSM